MKRIVKILICSVVATAFASSCSTKSEDIVVSCNLPMSGYIGYYGEWIQNGIEMARADLASMMEEENISFKFDYQDNRGETKEAVTIYQKQMMSKPDIYMSGITSQTMSILDQLHKTDVPHVLWSWTPLQLDPSFNDFRCWVNYGLEGKHITEYCLSQNPGKVAYVHLNLLGAKVQCDEVVIPALRKQNPDIKLYVEEFPIEESSFRNIAMKIKNFDADVIVVSGFKEHLLNITKDFSIYGIDKKKVICSMDLLDALNEVDDSVLEDYHVTAPAFNIPALQSEKTQAWIKGYKEEKGVPPTYTEAYGYDAMMMIFEAAKISKNEGISVAEAMAKVCIDGITGQLQFDSNGELMDNLHVGVFHAGQLIVE